MLEVKGSADEMRPRLGLAHHIPRFGQSGSQVFGPHCPALLECSKCVTISTEKSARNFARNSSELCPAVPRVGFVVARLLHHENAAISRVWNVGGYGRGDARRLPIGPAEVR